MGEVSVGLRRWDGRPNKNNYSCYSEAIQDAGLQSPPPPPRKFHPNVKGSGRQG